MYAPHAHISDAPELDNLLKLNNKIKYANMSVNRRVPSRIMFMSDTIDAVLARRFLEAQERGEHLTQTRAAEEIGMSQEAVWRRLKQIREQWRESTIRDWESLTQMKLAELDALKEEAWQAWHESKQDTVEYSESESDHAGTKRRTTIKGQTGNVQYLAEINRCIEQEMKLLGLEAPKEIHVLTWEDKIIKYLREGRVTIEALGEYLGEEQTELFAKKAGLLKSGE